MIHDSKPAPKKIPNLEWITDQLTIIQQRRCHKCGKYLHVIPYPHHALIHNNESNRRKYPVLVHHMVNLVLLCQDCHTKYGMYMQVQNKNIITDIEHEIIGWDKYCASNLLKEYIYKKYKVYINWRNTEKVIPKRIGG